MKILISVLLICYSGLSFSAPQYSGKVKGFYVNNDELVLVKLDISTPECGNTNWPFEFSASSPVAKEWVSMLLMAKSSQTKINVGYTANTATGGRCSIAYFYFY